MPRADLSTRWQSRATICKGKQRLFYSPSEADIETAKRHCHACEVRLPCRAYALLNREDYGVWGETSPDERRRILVLSSIMPDFEAVQMGILNRDLNPEPERLVFNFNVPKFRFDFGTFATAS